MSRITSVGFVPREEQPASKPWSAANRTHVHEILREQQLGEGGLRPTHYEDERLALWMNIILEGVIGCG